MNYSNLFKIALRAIAANKLRSFLTALVIIIGVASVITMLAIGQGSKRSIQANIAEMGSNMIMISPGADRGPGGVRQDPSAMETLKLTDEQAISVSGLIPAYEVGRDYKKGDLLTYEGEVYRVAQDHTSQAQWVPGSGTESLYTHITLAGDSIPVWQQPTGGHDAYNTGDKVHYPDESGPVYVSKIDGNTWSPDAYPAGWELSE